MVWIYLGGELFTLRVCFMGKLKRIIQEIVEWEQKRHDVNEKSVHDTDLNKAVKIL